MREITLILTEAEIQELLNALDVADPYLESSVHSKVKAAVQKED